MKLRVLAVLAVISLPLLCYGQSTLSFSRVMQTQEFSTTGLALINPGTTSTEVTFTLYGENGSAQGSTTQTITARGQLSKLASELFPTPAAAGWIQATSATGGLQGFWLAGDFATFVDAAEAAQSSTELVLPLVTPQSEIHIANTGTTDVTLLLNLLGADGSDQALPYPQKIPAKGFLKKTMVSLFADLADLSLPTHIRIVCGCSGANAFAATVIARDFLAAPSWAVGNGVPAATTATTIYFPHLVEGPQGTSSWRSLLGLTNLSTDSANEVLLTFVSESGATTRMSQQTLPPNGGLRIFARDAFGLTGPFQNGWVRVTSLSGLPLTGFIAYADTVAAGVAVVPPQQDAQASLLFAHIANAAPWLTGLALLNTNTAAANIEIFAMNPSGSLIGSTSVSLAAGTNTARLLRELIPQTLNSNSGFVFVRSNLPIFGIELFFSRDNQVLANVPAIPGNAFVLP